MKVKDRKKFIYRITWFSKTYTVDGVIYKPQRHGLAYGDVRSHCLKRRASVGIRALNEVPYDDLYTHFAHCKKTGQGSQMLINSVVRNIRKQRQKYLKNHSFRRDVRDYLRGVSRAPVDAYMRSSNTANEMSEWVKSPAIEL